MDYSLFQPISIGDIVEYDVDENLNKDGSLLAVNITKIRNKAIGTIVTMDCGLGCLQNSRTMTNVKFHTDDGDSSLQV